MPGEIIAIDAAADDQTLSAVLALNTVHEIALSPLDRDKLRRLVAAAFAALRIGQVEAFLIAFDQDAAYDSANFIWFRDRFARFVYVDRIAVAQGARGRGHARRLYQTLFERARQAGHDRIVCEVNQAPPNPESDAFHAALGFQEVGAGAVGSDKRVRYLMLMLAPLATEPHGVGPGLGP